MIERYSRKELKSIWTDENKYKIWLEIELAAAEAMEKFNIIPKGVVKKVKSKARINVARILKIEESWDSCRAYNFWFKNVNFLPRIYKKQKKTKRFYR